MNIASPRPLLLIACCLSMGACQVSSLLGGSKEPVTTPTQAEKSSDAQPASKSNAPVAAAKPATLVPTPAKSTPAAANTTPAPSTRTDGRRRASKAEYDAYQGLMKQHSELLTIIFHLKEDRTRISKSADQAVKQIQALIPKVKAIKDYGEKCDAYRDLVIMGLQPPLEPRVACDNVALADTVVAKLATLTARRYVRGELKMLMGPIKALRNGFVGGDEQLTWLLAIDTKAVKKRVNAAVAPLIALSGGSLDLSEEIPNLASLRTEALAAGLKETPKHLFGSRANGPITKAVKSTFAKRKAKPKVLRVLAKSGDWTVKKTFSGLPSHRFQSAQLIGKVKDDKFCRLYDMSVRQNYGVNKWQKSLKITVSNGLRIMDCNGK